MSKQYILYCAIIISGACLGLHSTIPLSNTISTEKTDTDTKIVTIIQLPATHWQLFQDMRLEALKTNPLDFGSIYQEELLTSQEQWCNRLNNMWFALVDGTIVGMIGLVRDTGITSMHRAHVISLWIKPAFRRQGIGVKLLTHLKTYALTQGISKLYLHVNSTSTGAISLYEKQGFIKVGLRQQHIKIDNAFVDTFLMEWLSTPA